MKYSPPFEITNSILKDVASITEVLGLLKASTNTGISPRLRRNNRIRTIQASLAIENNTLSVDQVTSVINGKPVMGLPREIQEVRNAFKAYEGLSEWHPARLDDLLKAHGIMMDKLVDLPGHLRTRGVGIYRGTTLVHMAPPAKRLSSLLTDLMEWLNTTDSHPLIASCVFHYEFEFIHPFDDGNGRMGRLWQTLILSRWRPVFAYLSVETLIRKRQNAYYNALAESDQAANATPFVEFMVKTVRDSLKEFIKSSEIGSEISSEKILAALRSNPGLSATKLALELGISSRMIEKYIAALRKDGKLERIGSPRKGFWKVNED